MTQSASGSAVELHPKRRGKRPSKAAPAVLRVSLTVPADAPRPSLARPQSAPILRAPPTSLQSASVGGRSVRPNSAHVHKRKPPTLTSRRPTEAWGPGPPTPLVRWAMRAPPPPPPPPPPSLPKGRLADLAWTIMRPGGAASASCARHPPDLTSEARQPPSPLLPPTPPLLPFPSLPCPFLFPFHLLCALLGSAISAPSQPQLGPISAPSRLRQVGRLLAAGEHMAEAIAREARGEPPQSAYLTMLDRLRSDPATGSKQQLQQARRAAPASHRAAPAPHRAAVHRAASSNAPPRLPWRSVGRSSSTSTALRRRGVSSGPRRRTCAKVATPARAASPPPVRRASRRTSPRWSSGSRRSTRSGSSRRSRRRRAVAIRSLLGCSCGTCARSLKRVTRSSRHDIACV